MQKIFLFIFILSLFLPLASQAARADLAEELSGKILLQVESYGRAWYVHPVEHTRYYLRDGDMAYQIMRQQSLGISNKDLAKIRTQVGQAYDHALTERLKGYILLQVESLGEAWYVHPDTGIRYYMKNGDAAYNLMREYSLGVSNTDLDTIPVTDNQVVSGYTLDDVTYAVYEDDTLTVSHLADQIMPIASLSKVMTALVLLDTDIDWEQKITISQSVIDYPREMVGDDATSEVAIEAGQSISFYDLWVAMLLASSNQSAVALADSIGLSRQEFIAKMNDKVAELGLTQTVFYDIAGLDASNVSTAKEMAMIAKEAFGRSDIVDATAKGSYTMSAQNPDGELVDIQVVNRNTSLMAFGPDACKTGFLIEAQRTAILQKDDQIIAILHARSMKERNDIIEKYLNN